ncbi:MAG TPA: MarR family winged helix-turn-helix transcriptional regulator [Caulobacteraceae bacterium]|jgi:DNA-binding MarR family transcriptional regulator
MVDVATLIPPDPKGEFAFEVHEYIVQAVDRLSRLRDRAIADALAPLQLDAVSYRTLVAAVRAESCRPAALAALLGYEAADVEDAARRLEDRGLLAFIGDEIGPTSEGLELFKRTIPVAVPLNDQLIAGMDEAEQRALLRGLEKLLGNLGAAPKDVVKEFYALQLAPARPD